MAFTKGLIRFAVISGVVGGAALVIAGPQRLAAVFHQTRHSINSCIDQSIEDPVALRAQLRDLAQQYPPRIAAVEGDLAQLRAQSTELRRERAVTEGAIELAKGDLSTLQGMLAKAESLNAYGEVRAASLSDGPTVVRLNFNREQLTVEQAYARAAHIQQFIESSEQRLTDIQRDMGFLDQQERRLAELSQKLSAERDEFAAQARQLDHQIDAVARNERMITLMERRQRTIDEHSRYQAGSLDQLKGRLAELRAKQESQLDSISRGTVSSSYEDRARLQLDPSKLKGAPSKKADPGVIQINPEDTLEPEELPEVKTKATSRASAGESNALASAAR